MTPRSRKPPDSRATYRRARPNRTAVLTIKCSGCKAKLWKYKKIGPGKVLRCHKARISNRFEVQERGEKLICPCGREIATDRGRFYKMHPDAFTHTGTKDTA